MSAQQDEHLCGAVVAKITSGQPLSPDEKTHLTECEGCMEEVIRQLDQSHGNKSTKSVSGSNNGVSHPRNDAQQALEHGRKVFEREFGVSLLK